MHTGASIGDKARAPGGKVEEGDEGEAETENQPLLLSAVPPSHTTFSISAFVNSAVAHRAAAAAVGEGEEQPLLGGAPLPSHHSAHAAAGASTAGATLPSGKGMFLGLTPRKPCLALRYS